MRGRTKHSGLMLLEILVAIGLLVFGMVVIGAQMSHAVDRTYETADMAKVHFLAESILSGLETGLISPEQEIEGDFNEFFPEYAFPQYAWRMTLELAGGFEEEDSAEAAADFTGFNTGLIFVTLEVLFDRMMDAEDAEAEEFDFDSETAEVVGTFYVLHAAPRMLDLSVDFGMDDEVAEKLNEDLAGMVGTDIDVHDFNPAIFRDLEMEEIAVVLPTLMQAFGMQQADILNLVPAEMRPQLESWLANQDSEDGDEADADGGDSSTSESADDGSSTDSDSDDRADDGSETGDDQQGEESEESQPTRRRGAGRRGRR